MTAISQGRPEKGDAVTATTDLRSWTLTSYGTGLALRLERREWYLLDRERTEMQRTVDQWSRP